MSTQGLPEGFLDGIPKTIWVSTGSDGLPRCYHGSPIEMVQQMAKEMHPDVGVHDAIDLIIEMVRESHALHLEIPGAEIPESDRAAIFVAALVFCHVARPLASA